MKVQILDTEEFNGHLIYLRKIIQYKKEIAGDRIRIMTYGFDSKKEKIEIFQYLGLDNSECNHIFNFMYNNVYHED